MSMYNAVILFGLYKDQQAVSLGMKSIQGSHVGVVQYGEYNK